MKGIYTEKIMDHDHVNMLKIILEAIKPISAEEVRIERNVYKIVADKNLSLNCNSNKV